MMTLLDEIRSEFLYKPNCFIIKGAVIHWFVFKVTKLNYRYM